MKRVFFDEEIIKRGLNHTDVGKATGVSRQMIGYIVNGQCDPSWKLVKRLVAFFGIPAEKLLEETAKEEIEHE